jgi:type IX secretion system PorP/SprF family membrane protein
MGRINKIIAVLTMILSGLLLKAQQDPQYSQYMFNQIVVNPAYAGTKDGMSTVVLFRKQWISMPGSPQTISASAHGPIRKIKMGIGGHLMNEKIGPKKWTAGYLDLAYNFRLGKGRLSLGLSGGVVNYIFDLNQLEYKESGELIYGSGFGSNRTAFDFNAGLYYFSQTFYAGLATTHINRPKLYSDGNADTSIIGRQVLNYKLNPHSYFFFGKGFLVNENLVINPSMVVKWEDPWRGSFDLNLNFLIKQRIWAGISYRHAYGLVVLAQFMITDKFKIGYTYDHGFNKIGTIGKSSHEIMLGYDFNFSKSKIVSPRYL